MIILPDKNIPRSKFLIPIKNHEWKTSSLSQPKDMFGNENSTSFYVKAHLNDGHIVWVGKFQDRDDFDAFLFAIHTQTLPYEKELWTLPTPNWTPFIGENLVYSFFTVINLTTPTNTLSTTVLPSDFSGSFNTIHTIGGGGTGGVYFFSGVRKAGGGGGGGYSKVINQNISGTQYYQIGAGAARKSYVAYTGNQTGVAGGAGSDTWFGNTTLATSLCGAKAGLGGAIGTISSSPAGGAGGAAASGVGSTKYSGGKGGSSGSTANFAFAGGGGGAGGPNGDGVAAANLSSDGATNGGNGDANYGGAGGVAGGGDGAWGGEITAWWSVNIGGGSGTVGSGGGGGGYRVADGVATGQSWYAGDGGYYGGGGGGLVLNVPGTLYSGLGGQGIVIISFVSKMVAYNMPILGL